MKDKKEKIKAAVAAGIVILLIFTAIGITYRYSIEGEENMPFNLSKIVVGSMVVSEDTELSTISTENNIIQNNGVYIEIKKNENYGKDAIIKKVEIANIEVVGQPQKGEIKIYFPSTKENRKFIYSNEHILEGNTLTYNGANKSDTSTLEINNQGGTIAIAFGNTGLGKYSLTTESLTIDGTMLKTMNITNEDIKFSVNFDLIIHTEGKKFKTRITLDLPVGDIINNGVASLEITDMNKYIFKRAND